jgi:hypothetical protein
MPQGERSCGNSATEIKGSPATARSQENISDDPQNPIAVSAGFNRLIDCVGALNILNSFR